LTANSVTLGEACKSVLETADPQAKLMRARAVARDWRLGRLEYGFDAEMPDFPARPEKPDLLAPRFMPKRRRAGSERARIAMLHALAHIEFVAIDLAFDLVGRFGAHFPCEFSDNWLKVGADEAMHFALVNRRLKQLGSFYGALPAHDGLWEAAFETRHDPLATRFEAQGDSASARILNRIYNDEIGHVLAGTKWFESACAERKLLPKPYWKTLVNRHFQGALKAPFNDSARSRAGLTLDYYMQVAIV
jgi:uncharacterized ferritin-like protein (DUF455 family)